MAHPSLFSGSLDVETFIQNRRDKWLQAQSLSEVKQVFPPSAFPPFPFFFFSPTDYQAFSAFDKQRNGRIPGDTLKYYLTSLGDPLSASEADSLLKDAGGGDGLLGVMNREEGKVKGLRALSISYLLIVVSHPSLFQLTTLVSRRRCSKPTKDKNHKLNKHINKVFWVLPGGILLNFSFSREFRDELPFYMVSLHRPLHHPPFFHCLHFCLSSHLQRRTF